METNTPPQRLGRRPTILTPDRQEALDAIAAAWPRYCAEKAWKTDLPLLELCAKELNEAIMVARARRCPWKWIGSVMGEMGAPAALMWWQRYNGVEPKTAS